MLEFKKITPQQNILFKKYYHEKLSRNAENSFANLCCYSFLYNGEYCELDGDTLLTRIHLEYEKCILYYMPLGKQKLKDIYPLLVDDAKENNYKLAIATDSYDCIKECTCDRCEITANRNMFDYLYLRADLMMLKGKKYQPKRNHINQFNSRYEYEFRSLTKADKTACLDLLQTWRIQEMTISPEYKSDYDDEKHVIEYLFDWFDELEIYGGAIYVAGKMVAFSLGSPINKDTFDTHIEKADRNYAGAYTVINKEMAVNIPQNFIYINREEDKGIMGLRQAKLSYHPYLLIEKYICTLKY
ncbi:MAG: DUF2156 domain-containing protein [Bacteroidales bacterium]|nr:DUF2156 domain-containing protein [Bacteroidales bacterium]